MLSRFGTKLGHLLRARFAYLTSIRASKPITRY
jgi:hypothetical protein